MDTTTSSQRHPLVALYGSAEVNRITGFGPAIAGLRAEELALLYADLRTSAPRRHARGKRYFGGRHGVTGSGRHSNRREEHLAVALRNAFHTPPPLPLPDGRMLQILDYQTPLKARRDDKGIGKIDLFGFIDKAVPCVIELKVPETGGGYADTPLRAFLEAFAYCTIVDAKLGDISEESATQFGCDMAKDRPVLIVMAPVDV